MKQKTDEELLGDLVIGETYNMETVRGIKDFTCEHCGQIYRAVSTSIDHMVVPICEDCLEAGHAHQAETCEVCKEKRQ